METVSFLSKQFSLIFSDKQSVSQAIMWSHTFTALNPKLTLRQTVLEVFGLAN